jgi:group I intron endonuclease
VNKNFTFYHAIRKYGWDNMTWEVLEKADSWEKAQELEMFYIAKFDTYKNGYNMTLGGDGHLGFKQSIETIEKRALGNSRALKGKKLSPEHVEAIRKVRFGNTNKRGTKLSDEQKKRISEVQRHKMKPVVCLETKQEFESINAAAKAMNLHKSGVMRCVNKKGQTTTGGFTFVYKGVQ